jgi:hypothetical protein
MSDIVVIPLLAFFGLFLGLWIHESTHYLFSFSFGGKPSMFFRYGLPRAVSLGQDSLSDTGLRIAGGGTVVYPTLFVFVYLPMVGFPPADVRSIQAGIHHLSFVTLLSSSMFSPSDCLALISPSGFRRYSKHEKEEMSHTLALKYIKESLVT